uniref:Uncharacterized protein n=1 Tax=Romanomermis culicivorax TaxID=13658 RepID=A0A915JKI0_ROMCU
MAWIDKMACRILVQQAKMACHNVLNHVFDHIGCSFSQATNTDVTFLSAATGRLLTRHKKSAARPALYLTPKYNVPGLDNY